MVRWFDKSLCWMREPRKGSKRRDAVVQVIDVAAIRHVLNKPPGKKQDSHLITHSNGWKVSRHSRMAPL